MIRSLMAVLVLVALTASKAVAGDSYLAVESSAVVAPLVVVPAVPLVALDAVAVHDSHFAVAEVRRSVRVARPLGFRVFQRNVVRSRGLRCR